MYSNIYNELILVHTYYDIRKTTTTIKQTNKITLMLFK